MAHTATLSEVNCFYKEENVKVLNVIKRRDIKEDIDTSSSVSSAVYASNSSSMGAYNQTNTVNQPQYIRLPSYSSYNVQPVENASYTIISSADDISNSSTQQQTNNSNNSINSHRYETRDDEDYKTTIHPRIIKPDRPMAKYTHSNSNNNNTKHKSKIHTTISAPTSVQRKRKPDKINKGLRHFSQKVCEKVKEKGRTTYNEVADELVDEEIQNNSHDAANCDDKNIRRRVYDALNVLMAMEIISKDKKEIRWIGLPSNSTDKCAILEKELAEQRARISQKHQQLRELIQQHVTFKSLVNRNKEAERKGNVPAPNSSIQLPFIIVNTHNATKVHCSVANDKSEYIFKFDNEFEMHDDAEVLKRMGFLSGLDKGHCSYEDIERAKKLVPPNFEKYIEAYGNGKGLNSESDDEYAGLTEDSQGFSRIELDDDDTNNTNDLENEEEFMSDID